MKVLFISDYSLSHTIGGAQRSNHLIYQKGISLGHDITMLHIDMEYQGLLNQEYDVVISSNMEAFFSYKKDVFNYCCGVNNHVRLEHDMCRYLDQDSRKSLFGNCKKSFFLTEHHINKFRKNYGDIFKNVVIVSDPISKEVFYDYGNQRSKEILYAGFMHPFKGTDNFLQYAKENPRDQFAVVGWGSNEYIDHINSNCDNVKYLGSTDYEMMPKVYNYFESMYYCPVIDEPFCRSVGEAIMCGMQIIGGSDRIGCLNTVNKYGRDKFITDCDRADTLFWQELEDV